MRTSVDGAAATEAAVALSLSETNPAPLPRWLTVVSALLLALIVAAPWLRPGLLATQVGLLPLVGATGDVPAALESDGGRLLVPLVALGMTPVIAWKGVVLGLTAFTALITLMVGQRLGGSRAGGVLATVSLLFAPQFLAALLQRGELGGVALWPLLLVLGWGALRWQRARWGTPVLLLVGVGLAVLLAGPLPGFRAPGDLLNGAWPGSPLVPLLPNSLVPRNVPPVPWLALDTVGVGVPLLALGLLVGWLGWEQRDRLALGLMGGAALLVGVAALWPGKVLPLFLTLLLVAGVARLPQLAPWLNELPWLAGAVALIALGSSSALAVPTIEALPQRVTGNFFGSPPTVALMGLGVESPIAPGGTITVTAHWQAVASGTPDLTAFVHLVGPDSLVPVAQQDQPLRAGERPAPQWVVGEVVAQRYTLALPAEAPAQPYRLVVGLYAPESGMRQLTVEGADSVIISP